jgi:antitoxin ParD1/3/4
VRTNIVIDDKLMAAAMAGGEFKTKREAVEAGLKLIQRRKAYDALLAARGTLHWDDSEEAWVKYRAEQTAMAKAKAAGQPFEGEPDPLFEISAPLTAQEPRAQYPSKPGEAG